MRARLVTAVIAASLAACTGGRTASSSVAAVTPAAATAAPVTRAVTATASAPPLQSVSPAATETASQGTPVYNLGLSERRAQSVVNDLVARYGIGRSRLAAAGYGLTHPVATNDTEADKALNRRVELVRL